MQNIQNIFYAILLSCWFHTYGMKKSADYRMVSCSRGFFSDNDGHCLPLLDCQNMKNGMQPVRELNGGYVKSITHVRWNNLDLAYIVPKNSLFKEDFRSGMELLETLQDSKFVVELVGLCNSPMQILTKYYKHGSADNLPILLKKEKYFSVEFQIRIQLATSYLEIIEFLHNFEENPRVMCDSNDLKKTLSQYLITDTFHLVLADLDAVPMINKSTGGKIKCGHRQLFGTFVAPEQLWSFEDAEFDDRQMPGYDEKTDIWKIPDVLYFILGDSPTSDLLKFKLFNMLKQCKNHEPRKRPSISEIILHFKTAVNEAKGGNYHIDDEF